MDSGSWRAQAASKASHRPSMSRLSFRVAGSSSLGPDMARRGWRSVSAPALLSPEVADQLQFALHRPQHLAQEARDLLGSPALQLPQRDGTQLRVAELVQEAATLLGHLGGKRRRRLAAEQRLQA